MKTDPYKSVRDATKRRYDAEETLRAGLKAVALGLFAAAFGIWYSLVWLAVAEIRLASAHRNLQKQEDKTDEK